MGHHGPISTSHVSATGWFGATALGASLVLIAFNGRAAVGSIGPVLREIMQALGLSALGASMPLAFAPPIRSRRSSGSCQRALLPERASSPNQISIGVP